MFTAYYFDQARARHDLGTFEKPMDAINEALNAIFDSRWAWKSVVEENGKVFKTYFG